MGTIFKGSSGKCLFDFVADVKKVFLKGVLSEDVRKWHNKEYFELIQFTLSTSS